MKILLFSLGPVPHLKKSIVEGGGLRVWGLANALLSQSHQITIAIPSHYLKSAVHTKTGISLIPYNQVADLIETLTSSQAVIYPTGAPTIANDVLNLRSKFTICIGDSYVPIHVEVSARTAEDLELEEFHFKENSPQWLRAIGQSDLLLCASESQKTYLLGVLAGSGYLTPKSYQHLKILVIPFGIERNRKPIAKKLNKEKSNKKFKILWYGGFYPWFDGSRFADLVEYINAATIDNEVNIEIKVVGAINPFVSNQAFIQYANEVIMKIKKAGNVEFIDWLPYNERHVLLNDVDLVFCFSQSGYENLLAWRTRYLDFIKFHIPLITNNIDPLGHLIVQSGAGIHIESGDPKEISKIVKKLVTSPTALYKMKDSYLKLEEKLDWENVIKPLSVELKRPLKDFIWQTPYVPASINYIQDVSRRKYFEYFRLLASRHGIGHALKESLRYVVKLLRRKNGKANIQTNSIIPKYSIYVHQLDFSGSPKIAIELALKLASTDSQDVVVYSFGEIQAEVVETLSAQGIRVERISNIESSLHPESTIILNGLAFSDHVFDNLVSNVNMFDEPPLILVHEDRPEMYLDTKRAALLGNATDSGLLRLVTPSLGTQRNIQKYFQSSSIEISSYPIEKTERIEFNYSEKIRVHLTGSTGDTRKNQLQAIDIIHQVLLIRSKNPTKYREIKLILIGINEESQVGRQIIKNARILGSNVEIYPILDFQACQEIVKTCNAVMCLSEYESLPLFVSQGMGLGQIVLRNNCSGLDEQLAPGKNGILLDYFDSYTESIEKIINLLDKSKTQDSKLISMSKHSHIMAKKQMDKDYKVNYGLK